MRSLISIFLIISLPVRCQILEKRWYGHHGDGIPDKFERVVVTDSRLLFRNVFIDSPDTLLAEMLFKEVSSAVAEFRKSAWLFFTQAIAIVVTAGILYPEYLYLVAPSAAIFSAGLFAAESFIGERFVAGKTFRLILYSGEGGIYRTKIRNNHVISSFYYKYRLSKDFRTVAGIE